MPPAGNKQEQTAPIKKLEGFVLRFGIANSGIKQEAWGSPPRGLARQENKRGGSRNKVFVEGQNIALPQRRGIESQEGRGKSESLELNRSLKRRKPAKLLA